MTGPLLRAGTLADAQELAGFAARVFADAFGSVTRPEDLQQHSAAAYGPVQQAGELGDPDVATLLAIDGRQLVAYAQLRRNVQPPPCVTHAAPVQLAFYRKAGFVEAGITHFVVGSDRQVDRTLVIELDSGEPATGRAVCADRERAQ